MKQVTTAEDSAMKQVTTEDSAIKQVTVEDSATEVTAEVSSTRQVTQKATNKQVRQNCQWCNKEIYNQCIAGHSKVCKNKPQETSTVVNELHVYPEEPAVPNIATTQVRENCLWCEKTLNKKSLASHRRICKKRPQEATSQNLSNRGEKRPSESTLDRPSKQSKKLI